MTYHFWLILNLFKKISKSGMNYVKFLLFVMLLAIQITHFQSNISLRSQILLLDIKMHIIFGYFSITAYH